MSPNALEMKAASPLPYAKQAASGTIFPRARRSSATP